MTPEELRNAIAKARGMSDIDCDAFLTPAFENVTLSKNLHDMDRAVATLLHHIGANSKIAIYGDYDADGIPGAAVLWDFFKVIEYSNVMVYLPNRHTEGYGLHPDAVRTLCESGVKLIITVDVGITGHEGIDVARENDVQVIVTDHHEIVNGIPEAAAVVNPKLPPREGTTCDPMICGAAVAWHVVRATLNALREKNDARVQNIPDGWEKWLLDLVGIATLSDQVPLVKENRIFASFGMRVLRQTRRLGIQAIFRAQRIKPAMLTEDDVVFTLTPRLNAASRMADPRRAFQLLTTTDSAEADAIAKELSELVEKRKTDVAQVMKSVHKKLDGKELPNVLVIGDPSWNHGILGLIASKLCDEFSRTTFVWAADGDVIRGSCRTVGTASAVELMKHASHLLTQYGGHDGAGGFTTDKTGIMQLQAALCEAFMHHEFLHERPDANADSYDIDAPLSVVTARHVAAVRELGPFGNSHARPIIRFPGVVVTDMKEFGKTKNHVTLTLSDGVMTTTAFAFFMTPADLGIETGARCDVYGSLDHSEFMGRTQIRIRFDRLKPLL